MKKQSSPSPVPGLTLAEFNAVQVIAEIAPDAARAQREKAFQQSEQNYLIDVAFKQIEQIEGATIISR